MARSPKLIVRGEKALIKKLNRLGKRGVLRKVTKSGVIAGAREVAKSVRKIWRSEARDTGLSARSITYKAIKTKAGYTAIIGMNAAAVGESHGRRHIPANIDHLIELGYQHPSGRTVPAVAPLRRGYDASKAGAAKAFREKFRAAIEKEATRK